MRVLLKVNSFINCMMTGMEKCASISLRAFLSPMLLPFAIFVCVFLLARSLTFAEIGLGAELLRCSGVDYLHHRVFFCALDHNYTR